MNDNDIAKCKKNGYVWRSDLEQPSKIEERSASWPRWDEWNAPFLHATREAAQAALDKSKAVESHETTVGETQPKEVATAEIQKPTTVRGWLETIPDPAIREAALKYCSLSVLDSPCYFLYAAIDEATHPIDTAEGRHFWNQCHNAACGECCWPAYRLKAKQEVNRWTQEKIDKAAFMGRTFQTGAKRDTDAGKPRMDLIPPELLIALCNVFRDGAAHYGEHNWEKGIPLNQHIASLMRHIVAVMQGDHSENHDEKMAANVAMFIATARRIESGKLPRELDTIGWCK